MESRECYNRGFFFVYQLSLFVKNMRFCGGTLMCSCPLFLLRFSIRFCEREAVIDFWIGF